MINLNHAIHTAIGKMRIYGIPNAILFDEKDFTTNLNPILLNDGWNYSKYIVIYKIQPLDRGGLIVWHIESLYISCRQYELAIDFLQRIAFHDKSYVVIRTLVG